MRMFLLQKSEILFPKDLHVKFCLIKVNKMEIRAEWDYNVFECAYFNSIGGYRKIVCKKFGQIKMIDKIGQEDHENLEFC